MSYDLAYEQRADFQQDRRQRVSPRLVAASSMLELSSMAMQQAIERELDENPALEADDIAVCQTCSTPLHGSICPTCLKLVFDTLERPRLIIGSGPPVAGD